MPRQLEQTPRSCCNKAFGGFPRASGSDSSCLRRLILPACRPLRANGAAQLHQRFFYGPKKLWVNPPKAERAKPSLSSDYNLLFKNKIGERSLDIHRSLAHESFRIHSSMGLKVGHSFRELEAGHDLGISFVG